MSDISSDFSVPALVRAIRTNLFDYYHYLGRSPNVELHQDLHLTWFLTGIPHPFLNVVLRAQLPPDLVDEIIAETLAYFRSRNVTQLSWWAESDTQAASVGEYLIAHGFAYDKGGPVMAADLLTLQGDLLKPAGLIIKPVADKETLKKWIRTACIGFGLPDSSVTVCFDLFTNLGFEWPLRNYVALLHEQPVATAQLFLSAVVAGIYWVATVPEARHQGIGTATTLVPLLDARQMGYRISILHSSPMGDNVYRRLGFQEHCKMSKYLWAGETRQSEEEGNVGAWGRSMGT